RLLESARNAPESVRRLRVRSRTGATVELINAATAEDVGAPTEIARYNRRRQITVLSNLHGKVLGEATREIEAFTKEIGLPPGYGTGWTGFAETMNETMGNMKITLLLAVLVIYMTLASQFESFLHPLTIMLTLPLAFVGALGALAAADMTISIYVSMAIIFLMGLVTKNAILLVDFANVLRRKDGLDAEAALLRAGPVRLRPILMTTVAMVAGMAPVALSTGPGSESRRPMAVCIIGGLVTSTLLTLLVVPVVYSLFEDGVVGLRRLRRRALGRDADAPRDGDPGSEANSESATIVPAASNLEVAGVPRRSDAGRAASGVHRDPPN
ncbi:MAG TPA: efflux RND transporter permease subunit, partial [Planctomycetota bacterium]|nr:efflux RND transporter permease subunit [Planctomycetota bacterium]